MIKDVENCPKCGERGEPRGSTVGKSTARVQMYCHCGTEWTCVYPLGEPYRNNIE